MELRLLKMLRRWRNFVMAEYVLRPPSLGMDTISDKKES